MENKKTDRRIKYTKMVIRNSFIALLKQKPISKISIKEICEDADINRATFYSHYTDQYDLLKKTEDEILLDIRNYLMDTKSNDLEPASIEITVVIFEYIKLNADICSVLLSDKGDMYFKKHIMMLVQEQCVYLWKSRYSLSEDNEEYLYTFILFGCIGIVQKWIEDGMVKSSEEIADILTKFIYHGVNGF